jgi:hypothetical protein
VPGNTATVRSRTLAVCVLTVSCVAGGAVACGAPDHAARAGRHATTGARAESDIPASGVCVPKTAEPEVAVVLGVDTPSPRCVVVGPAQHLRIENEGAATTVTVAAVAATLGPGESLTLDRSFGDFLAPGVHTLQVARFGGAGPQLWLRP